MLRPLWVVPRHASGHGQIQEVDCAPSVIENYKGPTLKFKLFSKLSAEKIWVVIKWTVNWPHDKTH